MKPKKLKLLAVFVFLLFFSISIYANEKEQPENTQSNRINLNIQSNFFTADYGSYSPLNPGIEFLYEFVLTDKISVLSGLNYIYSMHNADTGFQKIPLQTNRTRAFIPIAI
jgi:hypothetical protein